MNLSLLIESSSHRYYSSMLSIANENMPYIIIAL